MADLKRLQREHEPAILALREAIDPVVGPLLWKEPREARLVTHTQRPAFARIGPAIGDGVAPQTIDRDELLTTFNSVARAHGLHPATSVEVVDGEMSLVADDQIGTTLCLRAWADVRIWVDTEALEA